MQRKKPLLQKLTHSNFETIVLQVTTKCPYNCPQCYMKRGDHNMPINVAKSIVDEAVHLGAKAIQITGGEPLFYPFVFELIEYASIAGLNSLLATSGYNCSDETYSRLSFAGLTALCISVNGISEVVNRKSRVPFEEALYAIKIAQGYDFLRFLNVVITDDNIDELNVLGEYAKKQGISGVNVLRPVSSYDKEYKPCLSTDTLKKLEEIISKSPSFFNVENCHREYWEYVTANKFFCRDIGQTTYFFNVDGTVSPCSKMTKYKYHSLSEMFSQYRDWGSGCYDTK